MQALALILVARWTFAHPHTAVLPVRGCSMVQTMRVASGGGRQLTMFRL